MITHRGLNREESLAILRGQPKIADVIATWLIDEGFTGVVESVELQAEEMKSVNAISLNKEDILIQQDLKFAMKDSAGNDVLYTISFIQKHDGTEYLAMYFGNGITRATVFAGLLGTEEEVRSLINKLIIRQAAV